MKCRYFVRSRISEARFREIVRYFSVDLTALQITELSAINRNTINRLYRGLRERIVQVCEVQQPMSGAVEIVESLFDAKRAKGKRGHVAFGKAIVFGIFERDGQVYTEIVPNSSKATLQGIIRGRFEVSIVINSDGWRGYNGLVDLGYGHFRIDHSKDEFLTR